MFFHSHHWSYNYQMILFSTCLVLFKHHLKVLHKGQEELIVKE